MPRRHGAEARRLPLAVTGLSVPHLTIFGVGVVGNGDIDLRSRERTSAGRRG